VIGLVERSEVKITVERKLKMSGVFGRQIPKSIKEGG